MGRSVRYAVAVGRNADGAGANGASVVEISKDFTCAETGIFGGRTGESLEGAERFGVYPDRLWVYAAGVFSS